MASTRASTRHCAGAETFGSLAKMALSKREVRFRFYKSFL